jgi:CRP-like cAMP-binding protein
MAPQLLKNVYLFKDFSPKDLETLATMAQLEVYSAGDEVFSQGDEAASLFVIKHGSVRIRRTGKEDAVEVAQLATGSHFGELSFIDGEPRSANVVAMETSEIIRIPFEDLRKFFETHAEAAMKFYRSMATFLCGRLRVTTMDLSFAREKNIRHF